MEGYWAGWVGITVRRSLHVPAARGEITRKASYTPTEGQGKGHSDCQANVKAEMKLKAKTTPVFIDISNV